jgi:outer membrane receptor protein involved in Fe transport
MRTGVSIAALSIVATPVTSLASQSSAPTAGSTPAISQRDGSTEVKSVTVVGSARVKGSVDRRSYDIKSDLQYQSGSLADVLNGVPSVSVDPDGSVKLRGSSGVTILIDGEPAPQVNGANQTMALQQLRASQFSRVEVMTNPSAAFSPEGGAGIINLISRRVGPSQSTSNVTISGGNRDAHSVSVSHSTSQGAFSFSGTAGNRRSVWLVDQITMRDFGSTSGRTDRDRLESHARRRSDQGNASTTMGWQVDAKTKATLDLGYFGLKSRYSAMGVYDPTQRTSGGETGFENTTRLRGDADLVSSALVFRRTLSGPDSYALLRIRVSRQTEDEAQDQAYDYSSAPASNWLQTTLRSLDQRTLTLKAEYKVTTKGGAELLVGQDLERQEADTQYVEIRPSSASPDLREDPFNYQRTIASAYATYKTKLGKLEILPGARIEVAEWTTSQDGSDLRTRDVELYPTAHLRYALTDDWSLGGSYTERVDRLRASDLDEYAKYSSPLSYFSGRRSLRPEKTRAYELEIEHNKGGRNYLLTGYYRLKSDRIDTISILRSDGSILDIKTNIGELRSAGLEFVTSGSFGSTVSYKLTGAYAWTEISGQAGSGPYRRRATTPSAQANINWKITGADFAQISFVQIGKELGQQRQRQAINLVNLGYRRKVADGLFLTVTISDLFDSAPQKERVRGQAFDVDVDRRYDARRLSLSLSYALGRRTSRIDDRFDYSSVGS